MNKDILKKFDRKKQLMVSPLALAVSGCGGGGETTYAVTDNIMVETPVSVEASVTADAPTIPEVSQSGSLRLNSVSFGLTGDITVDAMTQGSRWNTEAGTMYYAVANGFSGEEWLDFVNTQTALTMAMAKFSDLTGVQTEILTSNFETPSDAADAGATIILSLDGFYISSLLGNPVWAVGHFPDYPNELFENQAGTMFLNINSQANFLPIQAYSPGGAGFTLLLHELGHALGLKHPHDSGGTGRPTFSDIGFGEFDRDDYTVMSYNDQFDNILHEPQDFMVADVIALMYLYGINENVNVYGSSGTPDARKTYLNTTNENTIFYVDSDASVEVALPYLQVSDLVDIDVGWITNLYSGATSWLMGNFQSVICQGGNDTIFGNDLDNIIEAGAGNDYIEGWLGNDVLHGMSGADTFTMAVNWGHDIVSDFEVGIDQLLFLNDSLNVDNSIAIHSINEDGSSVYTLDGDSSITLLGVQTDVMLIA